MKCQYKKASFAYDIVFIGSYCDWLKCHSMLLKSVIPVLLSSISEPTLTPAATQALRDICQECSQDLDKESQLSIINKCQVYICFFSYIHLFLSNPMNVLVIEFLFIDSLLINCFCSTLLSLDVVKQPHS